MESKKIVHVHLKEPFEGKEDYYFGSLRAIDATIPEVLVGITYKSLTAKKFARYENKKCVIIVDELMRNKRNGTDSALKE